MDARTWLPLMRYRPTNTCSLTVAGAGVWPSSPKNPDLGPAMDLYTLDTVAGLVRYSSVPQGKNLHEGGGRRTGRVAQAPRAFVPLSGLMACGRGSPV